MRFFSISDSTDTQMGLRLAGITGVVVQAGDEVREAIERARQDPEIGVLLITERLAKLCPDLVYELKLHAVRPLLVEIPDRFGTGREPDSITRYVSEAIGIRV